MWMLNSLMKELRLIVGGNGLGEGLMSSGQLRIRNGVLEVMGLTLGRSSKSRR